MDDHSSRRTVTCTLQQPTRGVFVGTGRPSPLIWPCSSWGLPCRHRYRRRGALLPHLFTLARSDANVGRRRCIFCGTFRHAAAIKPLPCAQALPGSPPFGARTFLEQTFLAEPVSRSSGRRASPAAERSSITWQAAACALRDASLPESGCARRGAEGATGCVDVVTRTGVSRAP